MLRPGYINSPEYIRRLQEALANPDPRYMEAWEARAKPAMEEALRRALAGEPPEQHLQRTGEFGGGSGLSASQTGYPTLTGAGAATQSGSGWPVATGMHTPLATDAGSAAPGGVPAGRPTLAGGWRPRRVNFGLNA